MSITELGAKRAMKALREAGFRDPGAKPGAMARRWIASATTHGTLTDDSLLSAAERYIAEDHPLHHWPSIGQLIECHRRSENLIGRPSYVEPEPEGPRATPEEARLAWKAAGYDPDAVREELGGRRGPMLPKTWAAEARAALDALGGTGGDAA